MTELLALSVDVAISPSIRLRAIENDQTGLEQPLGWGVGWYPSSGAAAMVVKDPTSIGKNALTSVLSDWERFASTVFVAHLRGAAKRTQQQDTHPFQRTHGGRDWLLAHNGDLRHGFRAALSIDEARDAYTPIGRTDSEHVLCWVLNRCRETGARRIADVAPDRWAEWLRHINALGTLNLVLTDGTDLIAWSDAFGYRPLHWMRRTPPGETLRYVGPEVDLALGEAADVNRTAVVVSTTPLSDDEGWRTVLPGQLLIARRGAVRALTTPVAMVPAAPAEPTLPEPEPALDDANTGEPDPAHLLTAETGSLPVTAAAPTEAALARAATSLHAPEVFTAALTREHGDDYGTSATNERILETRHTTIYRYEEPVHHSTHTYRLRPETDDEQELLDFEFQIKPSTSTRQFRDVFGNHTIDAVIREPYATLEIHARSVVRLRAANRPRLRTTGMPQRIPLVWMPWQRQMMTPYLLSPELPETQLRELSGYAMSFVERQDYDLVETLKDMNRTIHRDYAYLPNSTQLATTPFWVYARRRGVCQDFANLFIALCRLLDVPARYRVGYIFTGGRYENERQGDASHAWAEVYLPHIGWRGFDPTNGVLAGDDHVRVACGRNYRDATPTAGTIFDGGGTETLDVRVTVRDLTSTPDPVNA